MSKLLVISLFYLALVSCAFRKKLGSSSSEVIEETKDTPETLYEKLEEYRKKNGNIYKELDSTTITGKAKGEADYLIQNMDSFGDHVNFKENSADHKQYCEVIAKVMHTTNTPYQYAYDLWVKDTEIQKDFLNEYEYADSYCEPYSLGWVCVLMLMDGK